MLHLLHSNLLIAIFIFSHFNSKFKSNITIEEAEKIRKDAEKSLKEKSEELNALKKMIQEKRKTPKNIIDVEIVSKEKVELSEDDVKLAEKIKGKLRKTVSRRRKNDEN